MKKANSNMHSEAILRESIINIQELYEEYSDNRKCGNFAVVLNFFKGGITGKRVIKEETGK